jgi:phospholipid/cholesterol/gamma-HCH transport system ATP-binding protein
MSAATGGALIEVRDLHQRIGAQEILRGLTIDVHRGETLVLLGRSGGGKSVFLRHLIGLMKPISGEILVEGVDIVPFGERQLEAIRRKIGMVFQDGALFDGMSVAGNVGFPLRERGERDEAVIRRKVSETLATVNLAGSEDKMPNNLSGGMRKRVALARAIVSPPDVILYDEPTAGLDPIVADSINKLIRRLQRQLHATSIVVTHDMASCHHIADRVALLHEGKVYFYGTMEELRASRDPVIADFVEGRSHEDD